MASWHDRFPQATQIAVDVVVAAWRRFLRGPVGSICIARWVGAWAAYAMFALLTVATTLRERPHQVTLWWLFVLAWCVSNIASVAREQRRHDPRAWALVALVFLIGGLAVQITWHKVGLMLLVAAAVHSWPMEWADIVVQRVSNWVTTALMWLGAWALLSNFGFAALAPVTRAINLRGIGVLNLVFPGVMTVLNGGAALLMLRLLLRGYRRLHERKGAV